MKYFNILIILFIGLTFNLNEKTTKCYDYTIDTSIISKIDKLEVDKEEQSEVKVSSVILDTFYGNVTAYTPYCEGCIGITASGYDVRNNIYYQDSEYGNIRVIAADPSIPFGTIIKLSSMNNYDDIITIVLDRGGAIGNNTNAQADLLFDNEYIALDFGRKYNVKFEILRFGY